MGRYHFQAMEMTSAEILACIRELAVEERSAARLKRLLEIADFVKFAKLEPDPEQNEEAYQDAYYLLRRPKNNLPNSRPDRMGPVRGPQAGPIRNLNQRSFLHQLHRNRLLGHNPQEDHSVPIRSFLINKWKFNSRQVT